IFYNTPNNFCSDDRYIFLMFFKYTWMFNDHCISIDKFSINNHLYLATVYQLPDTVIDFLFDAEIIIRHLHVSCTKPPLFVELYFLDRVLMTAAGQSDICYDDDIEMSIAVCFFFCLRPQRVRYWMSAIDLIEWVTQRESVCIIMEPSVHFCIFFSNAHQR